VLLAVALAGGLCLAPAATAGAEGDAYVLADVECDATHDGVLDLTLVNERTEGVAVFVLTDVRSLSTTSYSVPPQSATAVTFTGLGDGVVVAPVAIDGADATVTKAVQCDPPVVEVLPAPHRKDAAAGLPATGSSTGGLVTGAMLVAAGMAASLVARRRWS